MTKKTFATALTPVLLSCFFAFNANAAGQYTLVDTDGDGVISAAEIESARADAKQEMISMYDTDGDGELSKEERRVAAKEARKASLQAQLDVNQDGEVSELESAGYEEVREGRGEGRKGKRGGKH